VIVVDVVMLPVLVHKLEGKISTRDAVGCT
jgi:hypothetical protein